MATATAAVPFDDVSKLLAEKVQAGIETINEANSVLLESSDRTGVREIDKALKEYEGDDAELAKAIEKRRKADEAAKAATEAVRNLYRTKVLGEEEVAEPDVDIEGLKATRKLVLDSLNLIKDLAEANSNTEVMKWVDGVSVPQVGRQGSSTVGQKKPRAYVTVGDTRHDSFGEAAKAMSNGETKVTTSDLVQAWVDQGEGESFEFNGETVSVQEKPKKSDS